MSVSDFSEAKTNIGSDCFEHSEILIIASIIITAIIATIWIINEDQDKFKTIK